MRLQNFPALCVAILAAHSACAADPLPAANPDPSPAFLKSPARDADRALPLGDPTADPAALPSLLPDGISPRAKRPAAANPMPGAKPGATLKPTMTAEELDLRVRYRKARNIAEADGKVRTAWENSRYPKTDEAQRRALKRYYEVLFAKMISLDRGIAPLVEKSRKAEAAALTQTQIAPTVPNE